ncbi:MAG: exodeoxyribonuclease VII large subunit [Acidimicrobiales bacterium]|nr:exodeoxyribonuclease VII large subunit [Acidimicrobiales bacterium]
MTLPLFDHPGERAPRRVTLVRLSGEIARSLVGIGPVAVEGEVHRPKVYPGGTWFTLRDRAAQMDVKVPGPAARRSRIVNGERVQVVATLQWANDRGQLHLVAESVVPVGEGAIAALIAETRSRLARDGLLERPRRPVPVLPGVVGVVCGTDAAVRKDIESVMAQRCPGYPLVFQETTVSGPAAAVGIAEAVQAVAGRPGVEVVILARGGGDAPSLLPWSDEGVCRAVAACPVPVVSAIGHEADRPLCDEVADLRCGTPSLAATAVLPDLAGLVTAAATLIERSARALDGRLAAATRRVEGIDTRRALTTGIDRAGSRLELAGSRLAGRHPRQRLAAAEAHLAGLDWHRPMWEALGRAGGRLDAEIRHLRALSPQRTLERGYAVVTGPGGSVVRRSSALAPGDAIGVRLATGRLAAIVTEISVDAR